MSLRRPWATRVVKLNSERRRAKRSPSFVLVVGRSPDPAFGVVLREGGRYSPRGGSGHSSMARSLRNAFSSDWRRQYFAAMRSWAAVRGNILARCVPGRLAVAIISLHASQKWPRAGKSAPPWQHIAAVHPKRAGFGKVCAPCIRKAPQIAFRECAARRPCQGGALFAARTPRIMHTAQILPSVAAEQRERRSFGVCAIRAPHSAEAWPRSRRHPPPTAASRTARALATPALPASNRQAVFPERGASLVPVAIKVAVAFTFPTCIASLRLYFALSTVAIGI